MSQYYQINIPKLEQRIAETDSSYPDRMTYHIDNLVEQCSNYIWLVFKQQPDGIVLIEVGADGKLYDISKGDSVWSDQRYCMHIDTDIVPAPSMIPTRWALMLEYAQTQWLFWVNQPIQQLNIQSSQDNVDLRE